MAYCSHSSRVTPVRLSSWWIRPKSGASWWHRRTEQTRLQFIVIKAFSYGAIDAIELVQ